MAKLDIGTSVAVYDAARPQNGRDVHPGLITQVHSDDVVSIRVIPEDGVGYPLRSVGRLGSQYATAGLSWRLPGDSADAGDFHQPEPQPLPTPTGGEHSPQATRGESGLLEDNKTEVNALGAVHEDAAGNSTDVEASKDKDVNTKDEFADIEGHGAGAKATDAQIAEGKANVAELNGDISTASNAEVAKQNAPGSEAKEAGTDGSDRQSAEAVKEAAKEPDKGKDAKSTKK